MPPRVGKKTWGFQHRLAASAGEPYSGLEKQPKESISNITETLGGETQEEWWTWKSLFCE